MRRSIHIALLISIVASLAIAAPMAGPTSATAAATAPIAWPKAPVRGQVITFSGRLTTKVERPVQLWSKNGSKWKKLSSSKTSIKGEYALTASTRAAHITVRVIAPKVKIGKKRYKKIVTKSRTVKTVTASKAIQVSSAAAHTCALTSTGGVKCWGQNRYGALGDGTTTNRLTAVDVAGLTSGVRAISAGGFSTCALTVAGGVKCWGDNREGQLGDGTLTNRTTPVDVVSLSSGVAAISVGGQNTCALTTAGGVKCWGFNLTGSVGDGTNEARTTPTDVLGLATGVSAISADNGHACALMRSGGAKCWGQNNAGAIGDGTGWNRYEPVDVVGLSGPLAAIDVFGDSTCGLTIDGGVMCWGSDGNGELGDGSKMDSVVPVAVPGLSSGIVQISSLCAVTVSGGAKCRGINNVGQIGKGTSDYENYHPPTDVVGLTSGVVQVDNCFAITSSGAIKAWGGMDGGLGDGTTAVRPSPVSVIGFG